MVSGRTNGAESRAPFAGDDAIDGADACARRAPRCVPGQDRTVRVQAVDVRVTGCARGAHVFEVGGRVHALHGLGGRQWGLLRIQVGAQPGALEVRIQGLQSQRSFGMTGSGFVLETRSMREETDPRARRRSMGKRAHDLR